MKMSISKYAVRVASWGLLFVSAACGLLDDGRDEQNKYTYIKISDAAFEAVCIATCDLDADGRISRYEARRIVDLACSNAGIRSLVGVEEFVNLRTLDCSGNQITSLDLRRNVALRKIECSANAISNLNISNLPLLTELNCGSNALVSLDVLGNAVLAQIVCGGNRLATLDVSACAREIGRLDARENPQLDVVYICSSQRIVEQLLDGHTSLVVR